MQPRGMIGHLLGAVLAMGTGLASSMQEILRGPGPDDLLAPGPMDLEPILLPRYSGGPGPRVRGGWQQRYYSIPETREVGKCIPNGKGHMLAVFENPTSFTARRQRPDVLVKTRVLPMRRLVKIDRSKNYRGDVGFKDAQRRERYESATA